MSKIARLYMFYKKIKTNHQQHLLPNDSSFLMFVLFSATSGRTTDPRIPR